AVPVPEEGGLQGQRQHRRRGEFQLLMNTRRHGKDRSHERGGARAPGRGGRMNACGWMSRVLAAASLAVLASAPAEARVTRIVIDQAESPAYGGQSFGT